MLLAVSIISSYPDSQSNTLMGLVQVLWLVATGCGDPVQRSLRGGSQLAALRDIYFLWAGPITEWGMAFPSFLG